MQMSNFDENNLRLFIHDRDMAETGDRIDVLEQRIVNYVNALYSKAYNDGRDALKHEIRELLGS